jgi:hypothetical protein
MHRMVFVQITHGAPQVGSDKQKLFELLVLSCVLPFTCRRRLRGHEKERSRPIERP